MSAAAATAEQLRRAGLRVTNQRIAVYDEVIRRPHGDADAVIQAVRTSFGPISTQAVYDVLRALVDARLLRRIQPPGSAARYEARVGDNHHHLVCRRCGTMVDVDCAVGSAPCLEPSASAGFVVDEADVTFWGLCPDCQIATAGPSITIQADIDAIIHGKEPTP